MSLELAKMELQLAANHVMAAQEQLERLESKRCTTPHRRGGPFRVNQQVRNRITGKVSTILCFLGNGMVLLQSNMTGYIYSKHYTYLKGV